MKKFIELILFIIPSVLFAQSDSILTTFEYRADSNRTVFIAGSFNDWNPVSDKMIYNNGRWLINVWLNPGYYYYKFIDNGKWLPDPLNEWKINNGGKSFNSIIMVGTPPVPERHISSRFFNKNLLPKPVLDNNPEWIELYYKTWEIAWTKIQYGNEKNNFADQYLDEGFNNLIYQWDTNFMTAFAVYGSELFPVMESLDNFYNVQEKNGYIQRVYRENDGKQVNNPTTDEPMINPPLFAWMELNYFYTSNDSSRLERVLPILVKYYQWIENNCRVEEGKGLYYTTPLGSGMDNVPRRGVGKGGWIDLSSQQALAASSISEIALITGKTRTSDIFSAKYDELKRLINAYCMNESTGFYYDLREDGTLSPTSHIGAFWTLISEVCPGHNFLAMREHLTDPDEFWRPHVVPSLSASDPDYDPDGHYWRGGVWAPTNYMVVKGLEKYGDYQLAHRIAYNHISNMYSVYKYFIPDKEKIAFEERYEDGYNTIWECYSPEKPEPATRWDNTFYSRQDFVGWSGLGPIALLIENIIGLNLRADKNLIIWHIERDDTHGISQLQFGEQSVDLLCTPLDENLIIEVSASKKFRLEIVWNENFYSRIINPGLNIFSID